MFGGWLERAVVGTANTACPETVLQLRCVGGGAVLVAACVTVLGGTARAHRTPAPNGQDFLVPTSKRAHVWPFETIGIKRKQKLEQPDHHAFHGQGVVWQGQEMAVAVTADTAWPETVLQWRWWGLMAALALIPFAASDSRCVVMAASIFQKQSKDSASRFSVGLTATLWLWSLSLPVTAGASSWASSDKVWIRTDALV